MRWVYFSFFYLISTIAFPICPKNKIVEKELVRIKSINNEELQLGLLKNLYTSSINCSQIEDSTIAKICFKLSRAYDIYRNDLTSSIFYLQKASYILDFNPRVKYSKLNILVKYFLGQNYMYIDNKKSSIFYFEKTVELLSTEKKTFDFGSVALKDEATIFYELGDYEKSTNLSLIGVKYGILANNPRYIAQNYWVCSKSKFEMGDLPTSIKYISLAIERILQISSNDYDLGSYYTHRGDILSNQGLYLKALSDYKKAEKVMIFHSYLPDLGQIQSNIGAMYLRVSNFQMALGYLNSALQNVNQKSDSIKIYRLLAETEINKKRPEIAKKYFQLGEKIIVNHKNTFSKEVLYSFFLSYAKFLSKFSLINPNSELIAGTLDKFLIADKIVDFMRQEHTGTLSKYFWRNKTRSLYESAIETCYLLKEYEKAYYFMEKSRAVMLNDKLNELGAKQKLNETDQEKERDFQRKIIELNTKIEAETKATEKEKLNSQLFDLQEQQERFVKSLETKYLAYYQLKYNTQIGTLKQMQAYLKTNFKDKNANMVSYFFGDSASYAMVISPTKAEVKQFKYDVAQNQEFVNLLATNQGTKADFARILSMGSVINQKLIKPLNIPKGHLIISQDGVFMPFEALSSSAASAQYLIKDYAISYTYSGQFLLKKAVETKFWPNQSFVGFAPVEFNNQLNSLKTSDITLGNMAKNYWFSDTFTGKRATKANFLQQARDHKIVQIFTHAFADSVDTEPKIYFADDALKISELNAEDQFNTQLLVLSACKTGVGKLAKGEGVLSLARGFSMLGIPATITSLWSVEDKNTYQLTELFYIYLNQGLSKDEALKKAKLEFLKLHPNAGPTDWAGMVLVGQTSQLTNNTPVLLVLGGIFVISIIAGGLYFSRNRKAV